MDMNLDILTQFPKLFKEFQALVSEPLEKRRQDRRSFFEREIVPIHNSMEAIHQDYSSAFSELLELFEREGDVERTVELLRKKRLVALHKRTDVLAFRNALKDMKKRSYLRSRELTALVEYAESIWDYAPNTGPGESRASWFSDFINGFQAIARAGGSPFRQTLFSSIESVSPPVAAVKAAYFDAVHSGVPEAWSRYLQAFHKLRLELTR